MFKPFLVLIKKFFLPLLKFNNQHMWFFFGSNDDNVLNVSVDEIVANISTVPRFHSTWSSPTIMLLVHQTSSHVLILAVFQKPANKNTFTSLNTLPAKF